MARTPFDIHFWSTSSIRWLISFVFFLAFEVPDLHLAKQLFLDGFIISMVSYTVSVSMALIFAQRLSYEIDFNQELLAMGASNLCGSFFACLPISASLSRSAIQQSTGGRTQIASIISCSLLAIVLLWIGPFFELLPRVSTTMTQLSSYFYRFIFWRENDFYWKFFHWICSACWPAL